jgi:FixJ family two-component response regulator
MTSGHIYLIDDDRSRRSGVAATLGKHDYQVHAFDSACAFLDWIDYENAPAAACVVTCLNQAPLSGVDLLDVFRADRVTLPVVLIGSAAELTLAVRAMRYSGAYILWRPFTDAMLSQVVASVMREWNEHVNGAPADPAADSTEAMERRFASLSRRQRQVLRYVFDGNGNRAIADALGISVKTVELHRTCMMKKMNADSLTALIKMISNYRRSLEQA